MDFADNVKRLRKQRNLTLEQLSEQTGVSRSMLSQIERGEKNPTIQVAGQIAKGLDVTLSHLLEENENQSTTVIRKTARLVYRDEESGFERHLLSPVLPPTGIEFVLNIIPPGKESGVFPSHKTGVKEFITVANGTLRVVLGDGSAVYDLVEGDAIYFEADVSHRFVNVGNGECRYYLVIDSHNAK